MNQEFNLVSVLRSLLKWKWYIIGITVLAGIAAVIVSVYVMNPYYQSYALLYPTNQSMGDRSTLFGNESIDAETYYYGSKHDANRIITIATSSVLTGGIIEKYNLAEHYEFAGKKYENTYTAEQFYKNYQVYKTDKDAIRINLIDTDPVLAKTIVDDVVETIQYETSEPIQANKKALATLFKAQVEKKQLEVDSLYALLLLGNSSTQAEKLKEKAYENAVEELQEISKLAYEYDLAAAQKMPGVEVIEPAYIAERKLKPVRSIICLSTVVITFFFACLGAIAIEEFQPIYKQL